MDETEKPQSPAQPALDGADAGAALFLLGLALLLGESPG